MSALVRIKAKPTPAVMTAVSPTLDFMELSEWKKSPNLSTLIENKQDDAKKPGSSRRKDVFNIPFG